MAIGLPFFPPRFASEVDRRRFLAATGGLAFGAGMLGRLPRAPAQAGRRTHGLSVFGDLKYPADFTRFDHVNPDAPVGGRFVFKPGWWLLNQDPNTFDTLNSFVFSGSAPPRADIPFDSLMVRAADEPDAVYGLLAATVEVSADGNTYAFRLRPEAAFHDGSRLTAEDVAFTYNLLKEKGHPDFRQTLREVTLAEAIDADVFELVFSGKQNVSQALAATGLPILSKAYWDGRDFEASTLEPPLGSGPYRIGRFEQGRYIEYDRVEDYWARDLPVVVGTGRFSQFRIDFYRSDEAEFEAFKKGDILFRQEFSSKAWATAYDFPALSDGRVVKREFPNEKRPSVQGMYLNLRRAKFADPRTREAFNLAFDFEWTNKNLFYGLYARQTSFFQKSDYMAEGSPSPEELAILEPLRDKLPAAAFGEAVMPPVTDGSGRDRTALRRASTLLADAGWKRDGGTLRNAAGEALAVEFLIESPLHQRYLEPFIQNLRAIGVDASIRLVDSSQYQRRTQSFDYDVISRAFSLDATPVESLVSFYHSRNADVEGGTNLGGLKDAAVDRLTEIAGAAKSRAELVTATRALDRVLRALWIWIPSWYSSSHRVAMWDMFGWPEPKPDYAFPVESTWWIDPEKAKKVGKG